jgi:hypothetical protein
VILSKEEVEEILLEDDGSGEKVNDIKETKPEWKAVADTVAVTDFFEKYTKKL